MKASLMFPGTTHGEQEIFDMKFPSSQEKKTLNNESTKANSADEKRRAADSRIGDISDYVWNMGDL